MPEKPPENSCCELCITLSRYHGADVSYSAESGLKRRSELLGRVEDYCIPRDNRFHGKPLHIKLETPPDPEREEKIRSEEEVDSACGFLFVRTNVQATAYDQEFGHPPIRAVIAVTQEAFDAIHRQMSQAFHRLPHLIGTIRLIGKSLPSPPDTILGYLTLRDLDVSEDRTYAVEGFEIHALAPFYHPRTRVLPIERTLDEDPGGRISILLTAAGYGYSSASGSARLWCSGRVINANGKSYNGAGVSVRFEEFDLDPPTRELPQTAPFGEFTYWPKHQNDEYSSQEPFWFELRHVPGNARGMIVPILSQVSGSNVILTVYLMRNEEELLAATDKLEGAVRDYNFQVRIGT